MESKKIKVLYGGAFDLLHLGHVRSIKLAKSYGDILIVNVNSDEHVRNKKGIERPVIPGSERMEMVNALRNVDEVVYLPGLLDFDLLMETVRPDILVINANEDSRYNRYAKKFCLYHGIKVIEQERIIVPSTLDTTRIIKKVKGELE